MKFFFCKILRSASVDLNEPTTNTRHPEQVYRRLSRIRRRGVNNCAVVDYDSSSRAPVYQKDSATHLKIREALCKNEFLQNFDDVCIDAFVLAMYSKEIAPNTRIIQEGDIGSHLYVSEKGVFQVYQGSTYESSFGPGVAFGELALLYDTKRLRSVDVKHGGKVWVLERSAFQAAVLKANTSKAPEDIAYLRRVTVFRSLPHHVLLKIKELVEIEFFQGDTCIIDEGDKIDKFFIINGGSINIIRKTEHGDEIITNLSRENHFGEEAFYEDGQNISHFKAIAVAPGVECYTIEIKALLKYLGNFDLIRKNKWIFNFDRSDSLCISEASPFKNLELKDIQVKDTLGVGAFGRVDLVTLNSMPKESFARKKIKKVKSMEEECEKHILKERKIMENCNSPFICKLYKTFIDDKYVYFLMEACLGGDLCTYISRKGQLDNISAKFVMACTVEAIAYLHNHGIIYRDIKPDNLMIDTRGYIKLTDFGSSKMIGLERTRSFVGTPEYMAPEIIFNQPYDRAVDYWSLGITLHEFLCGSPPFQDSELLPLYSKIMKGIDSIGIHGNLKKNAENLIRGLLRSKPTERLGNLRGGIDDIRNHKWFGNFDWQALIAMTMPSPITQQINDHLDTQHFEKCPPEKFDVKNENHDWAEDF
ncbi:hypothetical protein QAD02_015972 [Eretmocerus hayati]|uniref:Uncharacterized protein n=1 Tax=Eretmocerus hayati TaxID=131215 RepID=A0ACC2P9B6_9HYME|nr:hypothetical protein QAD02_015972 [Eretmocerus hayati]